MLPQRANNLSSPQTYIERICKLSETLHKLQIEIGNQGPSQLGEGKALAMSDLCWQASELAGKIVQDCGEESERLYSERRALHACYS